MTRVYACFPNLRRTPLDLAVTSANGGSVRALLAAGAGVSGSANRWGHTPLDVARSLPDTAEANAVRAALNLPLVSSSSSRRRKKSYNETGSDADSSESAQDGHLLGFLASIASDEGSAIS